MSLFGLGTLFLVDTTIRRPLGSQFRARRHTRPLEETVAQFELKEQAYLISTPDRRTLQPLG